MHMEREQGSYVRSRRTVEAMIEEMIALLDALDDDPDHEDGGDAEPCEDGEATLGWPESFGPRRQLSDAGMFVQALDGEAEDDADAEPSLGSPERVSHPISLTFASDFRSSQVRWADGSYSDREQDAGDEGEPDTDSEPTLGWPNNVGMGAVTLTAGWPYQFAGLDGEYEPNGASLRGGAAA